MRGCGRYPAASPAALTRSLRAGTVPRTCPSSAESSSGRRSTLSSRYAACEAYGSSRSSHSACAAPAGASAPAKRKKNTPKPDSR